MPHPLVSWNKTPSHSLIPPRAKSLELISVALDTELLINLKSILLHDVSGVTV